MVSGGASVFGGVDGTSGAAGAAGCALICAVAGGCVVGGVACLVGSVPGGELEVETVAFGGGGDTTTAGFVCCCVPPSLAAAMVGSAFGVAGCPDTDNFVSVMGLESAAVTVFAAAAVFESGSAIGWNQIKRIGYLRKRTLCLWCGPP